MAISANQLRSGMVIVHDQQLFSVFSITHRTPGNLRAFVQAKLRNLRNGAMIEHRFRSEDRVERAVLDETEMEFLYSDDGDYHFMNTESYEQIHLTQDTLGDAVKYLLPNLRIRVAFYEGRPVSIGLPPAVELQVVETEPALKGATVSNVTKPATLETGLVVQVPPFISSGEKIRVDTTEGHYLERVK
ncbi:MAG: elongation factor P [Terriglobales bacterium]